MKQLLACLLAYGFGLSAIEPLQDSVVIDSNFVEYRDKQIMLNGSVTVENNFGSISADRVELIPNATSDQNEFYRIAMIGSVRIALKDGGKLQCERAEIDFQAKEGVFTGSTANENVIYTENCNKNANEAPIPLILSSRCMKVYLGTSSKENGAKTSRSRIERLIAEDKVTVNYNEKFIAAADLATFQRQAVEMPDSSTPLPGLITLQSKQPQGTCTISNPNGDVVQSNNITIDTIQRSIMFTNPQGTLHVVHGKIEKKDVVHFSSNTLIWNENTHILTLLEHVVVSQQDIGIITTDDKIQCIQKQTPEGNYQLHTIESSGTTTLRRIQAENGTAQTLTCFGTARIIHGNLQIQLTSPLDAHGNVVENKQILFQDDMGEILSDKLTVFYSMTAHTPTPSRLVLDGHVKLKNHGAIDPAKTKIFLEYAVGDRMEFNPQTKELVLSALPKRRVLFFDRINNLRVSAPAVKVSRDPMTDHHEIQGFGDVRFKFVKRELDEIRKQFPNEDIPVEVEHEATS